MMLIYDVRKIGNKMLELRKKAGLTQAELAERAGLSDRIFAEEDRRAIWRMLGKGETNGVGAA